MIITGQEMTLSANQSVAKFTSVGKCGKKNEKKQPLLLEGKVHYTIRQVFFCSLSQTENAITS